MAKHIRYFETEAEFNQARENEYVEPWVSYTEGEGVNYNKSKDEKLLETPFTIEALGSGNISWNLKTKTLQYSKNGGGWTTMDSATTITVVQGDEIQFKGNNSSYSYYDDDELEYVGNNLISTVDCNVYGNIMSLTDGDNFENADTINEYAFYYLFSDYWGETGFRVVNAKNLKLPVMVLADYCYTYMFYGCTNLITAPELPATTLAESCYNSMFQGCTSLTTAPSVLPVTTLANRCYAYMFYGCTSLTAAPELPATTLMQSCYQSMFKGCTSLTTAPELPATALTSYCYQYMFLGCTNLITAPELPATALAERCYYGMFQGCTNLTTAPELPATALTTSCYCCMFSNCKNLTTAPVLPATTLVSNCYSYMFDGCTNLNYIKAMFTITPSATYTSNWVSGVAATGTFVKNSAAVWDVSGANGIPTGWTVQTATE